MQLPFPSYYPLGLSAVLFTIGAFGVLWVAKFLALDGVVFVTAGSGAAPAEEPVLVG